MLVGRLGRFADGGVNFSRRWRRPKLEIKIGPGGCRSHGESVALGRHDQARPQVGLLNGHGFKAAGITRLAAAASISVKSANGGACQTTMLDPQTETRAFPSGVKAKS